MAVAPPPPGAAAQDPSDWVHDFFHQAPVHVLGYFLDRKDFAALQTTGATLQASVRKVIRARSDNLPPPLRLLNLGDEFSVCYVVKEVLKREGRHYVDIISTGGYEPGRAVTTVTGLDLATKRYMPLTNLRIPRELHATATLGRKVFVMGGRSTSTSVEYLDLDSGLWILARSMRVPRTLFPACVMNGRIYVSGGLDSESSCEYYDPTRGYWTLFSRLSVRRSRHGMVAAHGKLYVAGGYGTAQYLTSAECFDPATGVWTFLPPLQQARCQLGMVLLGNTLYVIGGRKGITRDAFNSVECLDLSVPGSQWTPGIPMNIARHSFGAIVSMGKIFAIGGDCPEARNSIECFDPKEGTWTTIMTTLEVHRDNRIAAF